MIIFVIDNATANRIMPIKISITHNHILSATIFGRHIVAIINATKIQSMLLT